MMLMMLMLMLLLLLPDAIASYVELRRTRWVRVHGMRRYGCMVGAAPPPAPAAAAAAVVAQGGVGDGKSVQLACKRRVTCNA
jgi:hypothetical protein